MQKTCYSAIFLFMRVSSYAKRIGVSYHTAWRMWKSGQRPGYPLPTVTVIIYPPELRTPSLAPIAISARVSSRENMNNLERQAERLVNLVDCEGMDGWKSRLSVLACMDADERNGRPNKCWKPCSRMDRHMSQKPNTVSKQKKRTRKKKTKHTITRAVTHIRLLEINPGKLLALDQMMEVYLPLCQQYVTFFCEQAVPPDKYLPPMFETTLSERLHRVAVQQAAGIAKSWRTNRQNAYDAYQQEVAASTKAQAEGKTLHLKRKEPTWHEWNLPVLRVPVLQANANVVVVETSQDSTFDYWAANFHARERQSPAHPGQTGSVSPTSPQRSHAQHLHHSCQAQWCLVADALL